MSSTKRIQGKLFRGESGGDGGSDPSKTGSLTIDIPTNTLQTKSIQPLKTLKPERVEVDNNVPEGRYTIPYRDRLLRRLGNEYHGAERYRLEADRKKEVHWKRWGPYLSDRQWVRLSPLAHQGTFIENVVLHLGNCPRGLFPQRRCLEPLPPRARTFKGLSMGRRRHCRYLR